MLNYYALSELLVSVFAPKERKACKQWLEIFMMYIIIKNPHPFKNPGRNPCHTAVGGTKDLRSIVNLVYGKRVEHDFPHILSIRAR